MDMAEERNVPMEHVDHEGRTVTPEDERPDLKAIGQRTSDPEPDDPEPGPSRAEGSSTTLDIISRNYNEQPATTR